MYQVPEQHGRRFIVTGANSGTGREAARRLAAAGAAVVMAVRSTDKGDRARDEIIRRHPAADLEVRRIDLADLSSVRAFADGLQDDGYGTADKPVHALVNNAGVMAPPRRMTTADGFELQFGSNFLGPFALTNLLLPMLLQSEAPRVVTMSSGVAQAARIRFGDLQWTRGYQGFRAYGQSKLADLLMGMHLANVGAARGWTLRSTMAHPGYTRTNLQTSGANLGRRRPVRRQPGDRTILPSQGVEDGTDPLLLAATGTDVPSGAYLGPSGPFELVGPARRVGIPRSARGRDLAASLWSVAEDLTGTALPG